MNQMCCMKGVRKRSEKKLFGLPLYDIAIGADPEKDEKRGRARGIIAIGDIATAAPEGSSPLATSPPA